MKTCNTCRETKPLIDFYVMRSSKDGYRGNCKPCFNVVKARSIARIREIPKPSDETLLKTCSQCGESKPLSGYFRHPATRDGLRPDCKTCLTEKQKARYERDKPKVLERQRQYAQTHADAVRVTHQQAHRRRSQDPEWVEQKRAKAREYGRAHKPQKSASQWRRLQRIATASVNDFTPEQWQAIKDAFGNRCAYCGIPSMRLQTDHVIPLIHGGPHTARNIVPACGPCNQRKGTGPALPFHVIPTAFVP